MAALFVLTLPKSAPTGFGVALLAAATDFFDGRLARRWGVTSARGAALDVVADGVFVLSGLVILAWVGIFSGVLPLAAAISLLAFWRSWGQPRPTQGRGFADRVGHIAGIGNYGAVVVGPGFMVFAVPIDLVLASQLLAVLNLLPIFLRWLRPAKL